MARVLGLMTLQCQGWRRKGAGLGHTPSPLPLLHHVKFVMCQYDLNAEKIIILLLLKSSALMDFDKVATLAVAAR